MGTLSVDFGSFCHIPIILVCVYILNLGHYNILHDNHISCLSPEISSFSKEPWFLLLENGIRTEDLGIRFAHCYWVSLLLGTLITRR